MSVPISGILLDPYGNVARFADIKFVTVQGALDVIESSSAVFRTDENGAYSIDVQFGRFAVLMRFNGNNGAYDKIQTISVNSDTVASTLGELLAYTEPLTPAEILLVQQLVAQAIAAKDDAEAAALQAAIEAANAAASAAAALASEIAAANSVALLAPVPLNGGVWASGQTFTAYNQYMIYNGEAYSPRQETVLPYTVGATPDLGFVYQIQLNDHAKLSSLNPADGSAHNADDIAYGSGTVSDAVASLEQNKAGKTLIKSLSAWQTAINTTPLPATQFINAVESGVDVPFRVSGDFEITLLTGLGVTRTISINSNLSDGKPAYIDSVYQESLPQSIRRSFLSHIFDAAKKSPWGDSPINILGDSISHGANAFDAPRESWVSLLKRNASIDSNSINYGFISFNDLIGGGNYKDIADITRTGTWTEKTLADAADSISGFYLSSSTIGDKLDVSVPMAGQTAYVWFKGRADGATLDVKVNDVSIATLNTAAQGNTSGHLKYGPYNLSDDGKGATELTLEITGAGTADLIGFSLLNDVLGPQVNNLSQSGRRLQHITQDVANKAAQGARVLVLALGHNDYPTDTANEAAIVQAADYIISACNTYKTKLVVADFVWYRKLNSITRRELKRIADSVESADYLPFPDWFYTDVNTVPSTDRLINDLKILADASHPNAAGHELLSEAIAKACGLSSTSKNSALYSWRKWWPLELTANATNVFTTSALNSAILVLGGVVSIRLYIDLSATLTTETVVATLPSWAQSPYTSNAVFRCGTDDAEEAMIKVNGANLSLKPIGTVTATRFVAQFNFPLK